VGKGSGTTRGDQKRNARRERLRGLLPRDGTVIGIDLAEDKQALAVVDHDVRVLARRTVKVKAFQLGRALDWATAQARQILDDLRSPDNLRVRLRLESASAPGA